jgi:hypothetical protein
MPWVPELFTAPALQRILDQRRREALAAVPYFDGLIAGDPDPLVESFAGEPEVHDPLRGRVKGVAAFRAFVTETSAWLRQHDASVEDVEHVILAQHGFEEVVVHLGGDRGPVALPVAVVADRRPDGRIEEVRVYFTHEPLVGTHLSRPPLLQPDAALRVPDSVVADLRANYEPLVSRGDISLEACELVDDGRACALEYNVLGYGVPPRAGIGVFVRGEGDRLAAARVYDDVDPPG